MADCYCVAPRLYMHLYLYNRNFLKFENYICTIHITYELQNTNKSRCAPTTTKNITHTHTLD